MVCHIRFRINKKANMKCCRYFYELKWANINFEYRMVERCLSSSSVPLFCIMMQSLSICNYTKKSMYFMCIYIYIYRYIYYRYIYNPWLFSWQIKCLIIIEPYMYSCCFFNNVWLFLLIIEYIKIDFKVPFFCSILCFAVTANTSKASKSTNIAPPSRRLLHKTPTNDEMSVPTDANQQE